MASVPFIPRSVKRKTLPKRPNVTACNSTSTTLPDDVPAPPAPLPRPLQTPALHPDEISALFSMALSSYSLHVEPDLRRMLERGKFTSLSSLLRSSAVLRQLPHNLPEAQIVSALREAPKLSRPDIRIGASGFEIGWDKPRLELSYSEWERRAIYIENLPSQPRTLASVHRSLSSLLHIPETIPSLADSTEPDIQCISFPAGHSGRHDESERYRGFAFAVFCTPELAQQLSRDWPWAVGSLRRQANGYSALETTHNKGDEDGSSSDESDGELADRSQASTSVSNLPTGLASRAGVRVLLKSEWLKRKSEYLAEQKRLLELSRPLLPSDPVVEVPASSEEALTVPPHSMDVTLNGQHLSELPTRLYPVGCLVFARSLPDNTNRTALKAIFSAPLGTKAGEGVDYVDWTKGMDSCHVRFSSMEDAQKVISFFQEDTDAQTAGIQVAIVDGERERLYWEKVPEHLRLGALKRASGQIEEDVLENRPRKRRR